MNNLRNLVNHGHCVNLGLYGEKVDLGVNRKTCILFRSALLFDKISVLSILFY